MITVSTDENFKSLLDSHEYVVVKYYAKWCGICRLVTPKFKKMSDKDEFANYLFLDINAEENPIARRLAGVSGLPFFAIFKQGQLISGVATSKEDMLEALILKMKPLP
jgi:thioredoxin 1